MVSTTSENSLASTPVVWTHSASTPAKGPRPDRDDEEQREHHLVDRAAGESRTRRTGWWIHQGVRLHEAASSASGTEHTIGQRRAPQRDLQRDDQFGQVVAASLPKSGGKKPLAYCAMLPASRTRSSGRMSAPRQLAGQHARAARPTSAASRSRCAGPAAAAPARASGPSCAVSLQVRFMLTSCLVSSDSRASMSLPACFARSSAAIVGVRLDLAALACQGSDLADRHQLRRCSRRRNRAVADHLGEDRLLALDPCRSSAGSRAPSALASASSRSLRQIIGSLAICGERQIDAKQRGVRGPAAGSWRTGPCSSVLPQSPRRPACSPRRAGWSRGWRARCA